MFCFADLIFRAVALHSNGREIDTMSCSTPIPDIIKKKRDGGELSDVEIQAFVTAVVQGEEQVQPSQIGK